MKQGWEIKKLGEVCEFSQGIQVPIEEQHNKCEEGMIRFLRIIDFTQDGEIPRYVYNVGERYILHDNETAIVRYGTPGFVCYGKYGIIANNLFKILPKQNIFHTPFLRYWLKSNAFQGVIRGAKYGVALQAIKFSTISSIPIPVPPLKEQERIVEELDCLSGVIEKKREQLKHLDALAQSIFYQMFGDPITNEKGWEVKKLGEVCDVRDGTHDSPKYLENSDYVLVTSKNITSDRDIDFTTANYISKEDYDAINKRSYVDFGDIIMAMIGTIGKPIIVKETSRKFCIKNVALIKFEDSTSVTNTYIQALLSNNSYASYIQGNNKGGTQKFIALGTIRKLLTPIPPLALQQEFADKIEAIEKQKVLIKKSISETETLFNARMDYYFN